MIDNYNIYQGGISMEKFSNPHTDWHAKDLQINHIV